MAGFVECLDNEEAEEATEKGDGERDAAHMHLLSLQSQNICCNKSNSISCAFDLNPAVLKPQICFL